jgi:CheY-like chemotaxis protein
MSSNFRVQVQISTILLLEDNADDKMLVTRAIKKTGKPIELHYAYDGAEGIECLAKLAQNGEYPQPGMILSDLKMPKMTGLDFWVQTAMVNRRSPNWSAAVSMS